MVECCCHLYVVVKLSLHVIESFTASEACDIVMPLCALLLYIINPNTGHFKKKMLTTYLIVRNFMFCAANSCKDLFLVLNTFHTATFLY